MSHTRFLEMHAAQEQLFKVGGRRGVRSEPHSIP